MSHDSWPESGPVPCALFSFLILPAVAPRSGSEPLRCRDVHGFGEALISAEDPRAPTPLRLSIIDPNESAQAFLDAWSEDVEQVRRRLTLRRTDGAEVTLVATLAAFGPGLPTSLAVESIRARSGGAIHRSGVHPRAEVDAALALQPADAP